MDNNCHIPDLLHAVSYVENVGINLVFRLDKPRTCMAVAYNFIILITLCEQKKQTFKLQNVKTRNAAVNIVL